MLAAGGGSSLLGTHVAQRRAALVELLKLGGPAAPMRRIDDATIPGPDGRLPIRVYTPESLRIPSSGLVYFHGGGLVAGSIATHDSIARALSGAGACRVISVGYRLAPEHPFPAAVDDAFAAFGYIATHAESFGIDTRRLGVCGDSAGGTLAAVTCQRFADGGAVRPALQLLLCPILDYDPAANARRDFSSGDPVDQATLDHDLEHYLPTGANPADPRVSPLSATDLSRLPPTVIHTAECDPLRTDGERYYQRIRDAGIPATHQCHAGMIHLFYGLGGIIPYARRAIEAIGADLRSGLA